MPITGSAAGLIAKLEAMKGAPARAAGALADGFAADIKASFDTQTSVDGEPWQGDKAKTFARGTSAVMLRSGALYSSITVIPEGLRIPMSIAMPYMRYQSAKRNPLPASGTIPERWKAAIKAEVAKEMFGK